MSSLRRARRARRAGLAHRAPAVGGAALVVALTTVLAGCGDDPEPQFAPPPSSSPSAATPSAEPTPEPWEEKTDDGAVAFVEHWIEEFNTARATGETDQLTALSTRTCETCSNFVELIDRIYAAGGYVDTEGWQVSAVGQLPKTAPETVVPITVEQAPQILQESSNTSEQRNPGGTVGMTATVVWQQGRWMLERLDLVQ